MVVNQKKGKSPESDLGHRSKLRLQKRPEKVFLEVNNFNNAHVKFLDNAKIPMSMFYYLISGKNLRNFIYMIIYPWYHHEKNNKYNRDSNCHCNSTADHFCLCSNNKYNKYNDTRRKFDNDGNNKYDDTVGNTISSSTTDHKQHKGRM
jgi:hypothetical protein